MLGVVKDPDIADDIYRIYEYTTSRANNTTRKGRTMIKTSEYCAVGHPDRTCDYIASYILDRYLERDPEARVALEVQLKDCFCTLSGEVTSSCRFSNSELAEFCREAVRRIGYTDEYVARFGEGNAVSGSELEVTIHISQQSEDIAQGVNRDGWGDQGIFWGLALDDAKRCNLPKDYWLARGIANTLFHSGWGGLDIKTQVTVEDGKAVQCVVAIPLAPEAGDEDMEKIVGYVKSAVGPECEVIVNGTDRYVKHGSIGDCGTTGRKLVADFYGGNSRIGGGSPWGKGPSKADVSLNILARMKALDYMRERSLEEVRCAISCCIGRSEIRVSYFNEADNLLESHVENAPPSHVIETLGLKFPGYAARCAEGLFGNE